MKRYWSSRSFRGALFVVYAILYNKGDKYDLSENTIQVKPS